MGALIGMTNILAPIHELGHVIIASHNGQEAQVTGWSKTSVTGALTQSLAGYWIEVLVFCIAGQLIAAIGFARPLCWWWVSGFFFGYALVTMFTAFNSNDFNEYIYRFAEYVSSPQSAELYKKTVQNRWILLCTAVLLVNVPIIYFRYWRSST